MPDRIIRQSIRTSPTIDMLSFEAESMFYRLTTVVDDFGRFDADPRVLFSNCFPLKVDRLKVAQVSRWFDELLTSGLAKRYEVKGRTYGCLTNWAKYQRGRAKESRFPEPPDDVDEQVSLFEDSNIYEQETESDNICFQEETYVALNRESRIENKDLSSQTLDEAESLDDREPTPEPITLDWLVDTWNQVCGKAGLPTKSARGRLNPDLRKKIKLRLRENPERQFWDTLLESIPESPFLRGDKGWKATLDWLVENPGNALKVFEGNYNGARASPSHTSTAQGLQPGDLMPDGSKKGLI
jgi:hypothetical protein